MANRYEFGPYRLEPSTRQLVRSGEAVTLTPKAFEVLLALVERHDRVVDKSELMKLVWPDSFVEEANLSQTIFVLRKTLGEDADGRQYIDTIPRRGYRFAAAVRVVAEPEASSAVGRRRSAVLAAIALLVIAIVGIGAWRAARRTAAANAVSGRTRVVVLPFENLTRNASDDWLAAAFSDSITSALRDLDDLVVVSRDRIVELYGERGMKEASVVPAPVLRQLSQTLGVRYYVHGNYQRVGDEIRVVARVVDAESDAVQAQQTVTDQAGHLFAIEDTLARQLAVGLRSSRTPAPRHEPSSLEAYRLITEGQQRYAGMQFTEAIDKAKQAVMLDERYALGWAVLAMSYARAVAPSTYSGGSQQDYRERAEEAARRAVALDPTLYEAHLALALSARALKRIGEWRSEAERAIAINPRVGEAYEQLADSYNLTPSFGCNHDHDPTRAEQLYREAIAIDPRLAAAYANLIYHLHFMLRFDEALRVAQAGLTALPNHPGILRARATALMFADRLDESARDIDTVSHGGKDLGIQDLWTLASIDLKRGARDRAAARFDEVTRRYPGDPVWDLSIARVYLTLGDFANAATRLRNAIAIDSACGRFVSETPAYAPYRTNPQVAALIAASR